MPSGGASYGENVRRTERGGGIKAHNCTIIVFLFAGGRNTGKNPARDAERVHSVERSREVCHFLLHLQIIDGPPVPDTVMLRTENSRKPCHRPQRRQSPGA